MAVVTKNMRKPPFNLLIDGATSGTALAMPVATETAPTTGYKDIQGKDTARLMFGGTGTANTSAAYYIVLWYHYGDSAGDCLIPVKVADGLLTLGAGTYGTGGTAIGTATNKWVDSITDTLDLDIVSISSPAGDGIAVVEVDLSGAVAIEVEIDIAAATTIDVLLQVE